MSSGGVAVRGLLRLGLGVLVAFGLASAANAAASTKIGTAPLISPASADSYYGSTTTHSNSTGASVRPAEVQELARALKNDPDLIYEYVRNNTAMVWTYGLTKGAMGVIVDRAGTAFDQAHLMVELLRQSGYTASYNLGTITLTGAQFASWSGITSATAACQLLSSGGIPAAINGTTTADCSYGSATISTIDVSHAWVSVVIQGIAYVYDPAFKDHTFTTGMSLATATGMTSGTMISLSASSGATSGVSWISSIPNTTSSGLTANLNTYAANLDTALSTSLPAASVADIVGGQAINAQAIPTGGLRQLTLPYTANILRSISGDIPDPYRTSLRVQVSKARPGSTTSGVIDKTLYVDDIYGWRLVFDPNFDTTGATFNATLKLVDDLGTVNSLATTGSLSDNPSFSRGDVTLTANLPYAANSGGYMDAVVTRTLTYALPFTIVHGWGDEGRGLVDKWGQRRDSAMPTPGDATCKVCFVAYKQWKGDGRRELLAAEWLAQGSRAAKLHASIAKSVFAQHYSIGFSSADTTVFQTANGSFWITDSFDRLDVETGFSLTSATATATDRRAAVLATAATLSALKGNVTAQVSDLVDASSTANRFEWGNAPDVAMDPAGGTTRPVYLYATTTDASHVMALSVTENMTTTTDAGVHADGQGPTIGATEVVARRQSLSDAVTAYVTAGFSVTASSEAFLGPGARAGGYVPSGTLFTHNLTPQRGGALVAVKYDGNGDPIEIAHIAVNPGGLIDGGGGGAQLFHQMEYDPATAADVVKGRFVNPPIGAVSTTSPAKLTVGAGAFPISLTGQLTWRDGEVREETYGPGAHREPQGGWTTPYTNTLTISGSGLEAMGDTDARATIGTVAAFYAAQDVYKSSPSLKRDVVGELINAWWGHTLTQNVATVSVGTSTQQFVKKPSGAWLSPGPGIPGTLTQTGAPSWSTRHPNGYTNCTSAMLLYVPTRGMSYANVSFTVTGAKGDIQTFGNWTNQMVDTATTKCAEQRGFRMSTWAWLSGAQLTYNYARPTGFTTQIETLSSVVNNLYVALALTNAGFGGFTNGGSGIYLRQMTMATVGAQVSHTDPIGAVTKFDIATLGTGDFAKLRLQNVYAADDGANPAQQYVRDTLGRLQQSRDKLVLAGARAPTQYFLANGLRGETVDALGYSAIVYADLNGRPIRTIDPLGAVTTTIYDGRGRAITTTTPDGGQIQVQYEPRNLPTQKTVLANAGSAEAGQTIVTQFGWDTAHPWMIFSKDPKGAQTDYTYSGGELASVSYPAGSAGEPRTGSGVSYYPSGQVLGVAAPGSPNMTATYDGTTVSDLNSTVGALSGDSIVIGRDNIGDPAELKNPLGGHSGITRDALRRPTYVTQFTLVPVSFEAGALLQAVPLMATRVTYDLLGRTTKTERGSYSGSTFTPLETYSVEFDAVGNKTKDIGPAGIAQYSYDALNRVVCKAVRMNPAAYGALPADACAPSTPGPQGPDRISRVTYDPAGHVVETETAVGTPLQQVTGRYGYSVSGLNTALTDANGNKSTFEYDGFGRFKRLRYPASPRGSGVSSTTDYEENSYDLNGNVTSHRKRDGTAIAYQYDALNRLTVKDYPGTSADDVYLSYAEVYTAGDMLTTVIGRLGSPTSSTVFKQQYNLAGQLITDNNSADTTDRRSNGAGGLLSVGFGGYAAEYDIMGHPTQMVSGANTKFSYDAIGRPNLITYTPTTSTGLFDSSSVFLGIGYGPLSRRSVLGRPNGVTTTYSYDGAGRLASLAHAAPNPADSFLQTVGYNAAGQVISTGQAASQYVWSGQPTTTANFTHDQLNRDAAMAAASGYDANGNLISDGVRTFTYDAENRLTGVTGGPGASGPVSLAYDAFGRLYQLSVNGATTTFRYAGQRLVSEQQGTTKLRDYVYDGDRPLIWHEGATGFDLRYIHTDRLGSVIATSDAAGRVTPYAYGPYGEPQSWAGSRFRYTGQIAIPEAQLYHYRARAYDPMMGRFLQTDPIRYGDGGNIYAYVGGDPVNATDPTGTSRLDDFLHKVLQKINGGECEVCNSGDGGQSQGSGGGGGNSGSNTVSEFVVTAARGPTTNTAATSTVPFGVSGSNPGNGGDGRSDGRPTPTPGCVPTQAIDGVNFPEMKSGTSVHFVGYGGTLGLGVAVGSVSGTYEYTGADNVKYTGNFNTSIFGIGVGAGAGVTLFGDATSLQSFFGSSLTASGSAGIVQGSVSLNGKTVELGAGVGAGAFPLTVGTTSPDGPPGSLHPNQGCPVTVG